MTESLSFRLFISIFMIVYFAVEFDVHFSTWCHRFVCIMRNRISLERKINKNSRSGSSDSTIFNRFRTALFTLLIMRCAAADWTSDAELMMTVGWTSRVYILASRRVHSHLHYHEMSPRAHTLLRTETVDFCSFPAAFRIFCEGEKWERDALLLLEGSNRKHIRRS